MEHRYVSRELNLFDVMLIKMSYESVAKGRPYLRAKDAARATGESLVCTYRRLDHLRKLNLLAQAPEDPRFFPCGRPRNAKQIEAYKRKMERVAQGWHPNRKRPPATASRRSKSLQGGSTHPRRQTREALQ